MISLDDIRVKIIGLRFLQDYVIVHKAGLQQLYFLFQPFYVLL